MFNCLNERDGGEFKGFGTSDIEFSPVSLVPVFSRVSFPFPDFPNSTFSDSTAPDCTALDLPFARCRSNLLLFPLAGPLNS